MKTTIFIGPVVLLEIPRPPTQFEYAYPKREIPKGIETRGLITVGSLDALKYMKEKKIEIQACIQFPNGDFSFCQMYLTEVEETTGKGIDITLERISEPKHFENIEAYMKERGL